MKHDVKESTARNAIG